MRTFRRDAATFLRLTCPRQRGRRVARGERYRRQSSRAMRCMACGAELRSMEIALGDRVTVPGDEQEQWRCPACDEATPAHADAPVSAEPVALEAAPLLSTPSEPASSVDECEVLLRRAIEMVRGVPPRGQAAPDAADASPAAAGASGHHRTPPASILPETDSGIDECEALLGRAIEMVRGPIDRAPPRRGIADDWPKVAGDPDKPIRAARSVMSRVVRIDHDP